MIAMSEGATELCRGCKQMVSTKVNWPRGGTCRTGRAAYCKACKRQMAEGTYVPNYYSTANRAEKRCTACKVVKPLAEFHRNRAFSDGHTNNCIPCHLALMKARRAKDPEGANFMDTTGRYGISSDEWFAIWDRQAGACQICRLPFDSQNVPHVDHDHACCETTKQARKCGKCVRGLLCQFCNRGLGMFRDSPARLEAAVAYLQASGGR